MTASTAYRDAATVIVSGGVSTGLAAKAIPSDVQEGDFLLLCYAALSASVDAGGQGVIADPTGVTGWTALGTQQADAQTICKAWWKIAGLSDAGATVTVEYTGDTTKQRASMAIGAWSATDRAVPVGAQSAWAVSATSASAHVMPTVATTGDGPCRIVSIWMGRESATSAGYTASSGWTVRASVVQASGTGCSIAIVDSGTDQAAGSALGAGTITGDQASAHNFSITLALAESSAVTTARPASDVTDAGWTPSTTPAGAMCALLADSDDTTYVTSASAPAAQVWEAKLPEMSGAPQTVTNRIYFAGGAVSGTVVTALIQGTTVIATRTDSYSGGGTPPPTTPTDLVLTLTSGQQAAVTNLADLRIRCTVTAA
jgi:hypothetical protein